MTQKYQVKVSMKQAAIVETGIVLKQGDFGMQIEIEVLDFDATGTTPQIVFRKAMGAVESTTITVSGNKYTYTFVGTELDTPGKCFCDLKLKNSTTQRISTASFMFRVVADTLDGLSEEASSYSDTIAQLMADCLHVSETAGVVRNDGSINTTIETDVDYLNGSDSFIEKNVLTERNQSAAYTTNGYKLIASGGTNPDDDYRIKKFAVTAGDLLHLVLTKDGDAVYQFSSSTSPQTATRIGPTITTSTDKNVIAPTGATYLLVSELKTNTTNKVYKFIFDNGFYNKGSLTSSNDLNDIKTAGMYEYFNSSRPANAPAESNGQLSVFCSANNLVLQIVTARDNKKVYFRVYSADTWSSWQSIAGSNDITELKANSSPSTSKY